VGADDHDEAVPADLAEVPADLDATRVADLLKRGLEGEGYAVDIARDGAEALWAAGE
jgi:CheY-like chemotaxis protein